DAAREPEPEPGPCARCARAPARIRVRAAADDLDGRVREDHRRRVGRSAAADPRRRVSESESLDQRFRALEHRLLDGELHHRRLCAHALGSAGAVGWRDHSDVRRHLPDHDDHSHDTAAFSRSLGLSYGGLIVTTTPMTVSRRSALAGAAAVLTIPLAAARAAGAGPTVLTGTQATYSLAVALTAGTPIVVQNVPADGRQLSLLKDYIQRRTDTLAATFA